MEGCDAKAVGNGGGGEFDYGVGRFGGVRQRGDEAIRFDAIGWRGDTFLPNRGWVGVP